MDLYCGIDAALAESADLDSDDLARQWRELGMLDPSKAALGHQFSLFLLRNPDARGRPARGRERTFRTMAG